MDKKISQNVEQDAEFFVLLQKFLYLQLNILILKLNFLLVMACLYNKKYKI